MLGWGGYLGWGGKAPPPGDAGGRAPISPSNFLRERERVRCFEQHLKHFSEGKARKLEQSAEDEEHFKARN
eukprot:1083181-Pelagomonas_calceolata.AAC.3